ncbi:unnamed protein product [Gulo gulo]|uniref:Uncharacterized protein n=1 Tax=Gulo gulo TaxID=48420 RepID=A0A9X9LY62_GULGU|nr:unnamed protein product [Gulo gulo]
MHSVTNRQRNQTDISVRTCRSRLDHLLG